MVKLSKRLLLETLEERIDPTVVYSGGPLVTHVDVQDVYLGSEWQTDATQAPIMQTLDAFASYYVTSPYVTALINTGYGVGYGTTSPSVILPITINPQYYYLDSQIQANLQSAINSYTLIQPTANATYVVYVEQGVAVLDDGSSGTGPGGYSSSITDFAGYHSGFTGTDAKGKTWAINYAVIPYPGNPQGTPMSQGPFPTALDEMEAVACHEITENDTDPGPPSDTNGWYDYTFMGGGEICDFTTSAVIILNGFYFQLFCNQNNLVVQVNGGSAAGGSGSGSGGTGSGGTTSPTPYNYGVIFPQPGTGATAGTTSGTTASNSVIGTSHTSSPAGSGVAGGDSLHASGNGSTSTGPTGSSGSSGSSGSIIGGGHDDAIVHSGSGSSGTPGTDQILTIRLSSPAAKLPALTPPPSAPNTPAPAPSPTPVTQPVTPVIITPAPSETPTTSTVVGGPRLPTDTGTLPLPGEGIEG